MKPLLFDLAATQPSGAVAFHGGADYAKEVFYSLMSMRGDRPITFFYDKHRPLDPSIRAFFNTSGCLFTGIRPDRDLQDLLRTTRFATFYSALSRASYADLEMEGARFLVTIHGLRAIEMPGDAYELKYGWNARQLISYCYRKCWPDHDYRRKLALYEAVAARASLVFAPTYHTKFALLSSVPGLHEAQVKVVYSPRKRMTEEGDDLPASRFGVDHKDYILLVSACRWLKNSLRVVEALDELYTHGAELPAKVLLLGATRPSVFSHLRNKNRFVFRGYVSEPELQACYRNAALFIYPSLNEGFGYPPLEAMRHGTPVMASAISSIPEVCGAAATYFNPFSKLEIRTRIMQCLGQPDVLEKMRHAGPLHARWMAAQQDQMLAGLTSEVLSR